MSQVYWWDDDQLQEWQKEILNREGYEQPRAKDKRCGSRGYRPVGGKK